MNSFKMAYTLLKNNLKTYGLYLIVLIVTVATYYNFTAIQYNESFTKITDQYIYAQSASIICSVVLLITVLFFMSNANEFFFKQRQKETGLYMLMGITSSKIGKIFAMESIFLGGIAIIIGMPVGIAFSKLFFMLLGNAMLLETQIPFEIPIKAISHIIVVFSVVFLFLGFKNYIIVKKSQLIDMINASKKNQSVPKLNYIKGILGVVLIISGYILAMNALKWGVNLLGAAYLVLIVVCAGTYFFFGSFLSILLKSLISNKKILYKKSSLVSINNTFFRLKGSYKNLAMTAILAASTLTAFGASLSIKQYCDDNVLMQAPYSFSYIYQGKDVEDRIMSIIENSEHEVTEENTSSFIVVSTGKYDSIVTSYSEIGNTLDFLEYNKREKILGNISPNDHEATHIRHAGLLGSAMTSVGEILCIDEKEYTIKAETKLPFIGENPTYGTHSIYVVGDSEYEKLKVNHKEVILKGFQLSKQEESLELVMEIMKEIPEIDEGSNAYVLWYGYKYYVMGAFYFLGMIMSLIFILATFSTLYFKILSDALMDSEQYIILRNIGVSKKEVGKSVKMQVAIGFILPTIVGVIHSLVAMNILEDLMKGSFTEAITISIIIFIIFMVLFYLGICKSYTNMVYKKEN